MPKYILKKDNTHTLHSGGSYANPVIFSPINYQLTSSTFKKSCTTSQNLQYNNTNYKPVTTGMIDNPPGSIINYSIPDQIINNGWNLMRLGNSQTGVSYKSGTEVKYYSGAGLMIFERRHRNNARNEPSVLLFNSNEIYQDLGGMINSGDFRSDQSLQITAKRETLEESANYVDIQFNLNRLINNVPMFVDVIHNNTFYRCYTIGLDEDVFNIGSLIHNIDMLKKMPHIPDSWKEISGAHRFYISDIIKCIKSNSDEFVCNDASGQNHKIRGRTINVLKQMLQSYGTNKSIAEKVLSYVSMTQEYANAYGMQKLLIY